MSLRFMPSIIIAHSLGLSLLPQWKGSREKFQKLTTLDFTILSLTVLSASTWPALISSWTLSFLSVMTRSLKQLGYSLPPGSFYSNALRILFVSPNCPLSLNCWIFSTLTSGVCDLSSAKPLFLKSLLWTFSPPIFLLWIKPCFLSLFSLYSLFHDFIQDYINSILTTLKSIYSSGPLFHSPDMCVYLTSCVPLSLFFFLYLLCFHYALSHYYLSCKVLSLHFCFVPYTLFTWLLKRFFKILSQILPLPAQKSCLDSLFQPKYVIHVIAFYPPTTLLTSLPLSLHLGHSLLCKNSRV